MPPSDAHGAPLIALDDADRLLTAFGRQVRDALLHLHDLLYLQTHPLARFVSSPPGSRVANRGRELQRAMLEAIQALRPDRARGKRDERSYLILLISA
jgi:hypothetical protein